MIDSTSKSSLLGRPSPYSFITGIFTFAGMEAFLRTFPSLPTLSTFISRVSIFTSISLPDTTWTGHMSTYRRPRTAPINRTSGLGSNAQIAARRRNLKEVQEQLKRQVSSTEWKVFFQNESKILSWRSMLERSCERGNVYDLERLNYLVRHG